MTERAHAVTLVAKVLSVMRKPPQALRASSPKGAPLRNAGNFAATAKSRPLGEGGCERSEQTEGVFLSVKIQCRSVRRRSGIVLF